MPPLSWRRFSSLHAVQLQLQLGEVLADRADRDRDAQRLAGRQRRVLGTEQQLQCAAVLPTLSGPVATVIKPFGLKGNGNGAADVSWTTPDGTLTVHHSANQVGNNPVGHFTLKGTTCYFTTTFSKGTFNYVPSKSTGTWAKVTQHGTGHYMVTAAGSAPLSKGKTSCTFSNIGAVQSSGAKIAFAAAAPVTVAS